MYIKPKVHTSFPLAANANGATWVVGYTTGMATASFFGDAWKVKTARTERYDNGKFYQCIDGYRLAGPQWVNYMLEVARL